MKLGWHKTSSWWYGTSVVDADKHHEGRPDALALYIEGPAQAINTSLRTGMSVFKPEEAFGLTLETLCDELDAQLDGIQGDVPDVVVRVDDGQLANYISNEVVVDNGYLSTTILSEITMGADRAFSYRIHGLKPGCGADISEFSRYNTEKEFLFKRGAKFSVLSKSPREVVGQTGVHYELRFEGFGCTEPKPCGTLRRRFRKCPWCGGIMDSRENPDESCPNHWA